MRLDKMTAIGRVNDHFVEAQALRLEFLCSDGRFDVDAVLGVIEVGRVDVIAPSSFVRMHCVCPLLVIPYLLLYFRDSLDPLEHLY